MNYVIITILFLIIARWLFKIAPKPGSIVPNVDVSRYKEMNKIPLKDSPHDRIMDEIKLEQDKFMYRPRTPKEPGDSHIDYTNYPI